MKRCSALVLWKIQTQTTRRYHFTLTRLDRIKKSDINQCWRVCGETEALIYCWCKCNQRLNLELPYTQKFYSQIDITRELKTSSHKKFHTSVYSSHIHNSWKAERTQMFINWWINRVYFILTVEYFLAHTQRMKDWYILLT